MPRIFEVCQMIGTTSKLLLVDFSGGSGQLVRQALEGTGNQCSLVEASDLTRAFEAMGDDEPVAVVVSTAGVAADAVTVVKTVLSRYCAVPVILLTELVGEPAAALSVAEGASGYVIRTDNCRAMLERLLSDAFRRYAGSDSASELERIKCQIKKVDHMKSELTENLCHELRTPLSSIRGYTELMLKGKMGEIGDKQKTALGIVLKNADKLLVIIDELSDFSKVQNYRESSNIRKIDVVNVVQESLAALATRAIERKVTLDFTIPVRPYFISGDYSQMSFVFSAVIGGALKGGGDNGRIQITLQHDDKKISVFIPGTAMIDEVPRLAETLSAFYSSEIPGQRQLVSCPVEFSLAAEIIKMHGGVMAVCEGTGGRTGLRLTFPLYFEEDISHLNIPDRTSATGKKKILITDDDPDCVNLLRDILSVDYNLVVTNSAYSMFRALEEHRDFSLILLDINMVDLDGISICRTLKDKPEFANIPILMISASMQEMKKRMSLEAGAMGFLEKPFEAEKISQFISSIL